MYKTQSANHQRKVGAATRPFTRSHARPEGLRIGSKSSAHERQAEHFARRFGPPNSPDRQPADDGRTHAPRWVEDQITMLRGRPGQSPSAAIRRDIGAELGTDLSGVRIHDGPAADVLARAIHASAFTVGKDVFFRAGSFQPHTDQGRQLLAHELAHTQQPAEGIHRTIFMEGEPFSPDMTAIVHGEQTLYEAIDELGAEGWSIFHDMLDEASGVFFFDYLIDLILEIKYRIEMGSTMLALETKNTCCSYGGGGSYYHLDGSQWKPRVPPGKVVKRDLLDTSEPDPGDGYESIFELAPGRKPSEAIESIFAAGANSRLECNSMMIAIAYKSLLDALGAPIFDNIFARECVAIEPAFNAGNGLSTHPLLSRYFESIEVPVPVGDETKHLLAGDWVYFRNHPKYLEWAPGGAFQGENGVYVGNGKFAGFGLTGVVSGTGPTFTYDGVIDILEHVTNSVYPGAASGEPAPKRADIPGLHGPGGDTVVRRINMSKLLDQVKV